MNDREVNLRLHNGIQQVREDIFGDHGHDFHNLTVAEASGADGLNIGVADMAAVTNDLHREPHGGVRIRITRSATTIDGDLLRADLRQIEAQIAVRLDFASGRLRRSLSSRDAIGETTP